VGERDSWGLGFSDNRVFQKQYYVQAFSDPELRLYLHTGEQYLSAQPAVDATELIRVVDQAARTDDDLTVIACEHKDGEWLLPVTGTGFEATFGLRLTRVDALESAHSPAPPLTTAGS
jgi:hypothetical protein